MSLYALPGLLFPPIELVKSTGCSSTSPEISAQSSLPQEEEPANDIIDSDEPTLIVKGAMFDPVRFVNSLTRCAKKKFYPARRTQSAGDLRLVDKVPSSSSATSKKEASSLQQTESISSYEEATKFVLSIVHNGRRYTATRTLPSIMELRNGLVREMEQHQQNGASSEGNNDDDDTATVESSKGSWSGGSEESLSSSSNIIPELPSLTEGSNETASSTPSPSTNRGSTSQCSPYVSHNTTTSVSSKENRACGFTVMHAYVKAYCAPLQFWLRAILKVVPMDSPTLTKFLWEPHNEKSASIVSSHRSKKKYGIRRNASTHSMGLNSIQEMGSAEEDEERDDEIDDVDFIQFNPSAA